MFRFLFFLFFLFFLLPISSFLIDTIKYDYSSFPKKTFHHHIFSDDISFSYDRYPILQGKRKYKFFFHSIYFLSDFLFEKVKLSILSIHESSNSFTISWYLYGFFIFSPIHLYGKSIYSKNKFNLIHEHNISLDNIQNNVLPSCYNHPLLRRPIRVPINDQYFFFKQ